MTILCRPRPRDWGAMFLKTCPAARPSLRAVSAVTGSMFAVPRTPSGPKIFFGWFIYGSRLRVVTQGGFRGGNPFHGAFFGGHFDPEHVRGGWGADFFSEAC